MGILVRQEPIVTMGVPVFYEPIEAVDSTGTPLQKRKLPLNELYCLFIITEALMCI